MQYYVYKITNLINGKFYIGVHKTRNIDDNYMGSGTILKRSMLKYGIDNFKKEILIHCESEFDMFELESLIVDQEFILRKDTYNIKLGGFGGFDYINSSNKNLYGMNGKTPNIKPMLMQKRAEHNYKLKHDESYRSKISKSITESLLIRYQTHVHTWVGRSHTKESKDKIGKANSIHQIGTKNSQYGTMWIYSPTEKRNIKIPKCDPIPQGWIKGRKMHFE